MLSQFIKEAGETRAAWAAKLGISPPHMSDLLNGKKLPSLELAVKIERATDNKVPASSWLAPDAVA